VADLREKSLFQVVREVARQHPLEVEHVLDGLLMRVPDVETRYRYWKEVKAALSDNNPETYAMDGACTLCRVLLGVLRLVLDNSDDHNAVMNTVYEYCYMLFQAIDQTIDGRQLCLAVYIQGPHVAEIVQFTGALPPAPSLEDLCRSLNACFEVPDPDDVLMGPHSLPPQSLPRPRGGRAGRAAREAKLKRLQSRKMDAIKVAQLTDIHIERNYAEGSQQYCGLYVCCKAVQGPGNAGYHASYQCNIPERTIRLFLEHVASLSPHLVLFSGDIPPHTVWDETEESQMACTETLTTVMKEILGDFVVYPTIGNHEMYPTNLFSMRFVNHTVSMVSNFARLWTDLAHFTDDQIETMNEAGYYTIVSPVNDKLRILAINNVYMYANNFYNLLNYYPVSLLPPTPGEAVVMKNNIRAILQSAVSNDEKVILMTHHVIGNGDFIVSEAVWWEELINEFADVIVLQVAGHTHTDEFRLIKSPDNTVRHMMYVNPSVDTHNTVNPSMRLYYLDPETFELLDYDQYYFHLPTYPDNTTVPEIVRLYSAMEEYPLADMSAGSWEALLKSFETDNDLLRTHIGHGKANARGVPSTCDDNCRRRHTCRQLHSRYDHYQLCAAGPVPTPPTTVSQTWPTLTTPAHRRPGV